MEFCVGKNIQYSNVGDKEQLTSSWSGVGGVGQWLKTVPLAIKKNEEAQMYWYRGICKIYSVKKSKV